MTSPPVVSARVPAPLTPFIGRDGRIETAWQALQRTRLLTLTGPGGSGKTRLAVELASRSEPAAWVELSALDDPRQLTEHIATTLGVSDRSGQPSLAHIVDRYAASGLLLVLDNCEHLVAAVAPFVAQVLRECSTMKVLATSREALGVTGERTLAVPPLSLPRDDTLGAVTAADATALFVERAQDVRPDVEVTERNAAAVARICRRLDGIPLAIELAAARVRALDLEQLAERLESSVGLLETGSRTAEPRHRTIRDTLDWSYRLLPEPERALVRGLAVFTGTFSLDAVEAVCADPGEPREAVLQRVTALLDKSLLVCEPGDAGMRYRMLETVHEYAAEQLAAGGERDAARERHARFFVALAERGAPAIFGGVGDESWMARFDEDAANFREAHDWCEQDASRLELSLRLAVALHWYWFARGRFNEGRLRVGIALTFSDGIDPVLRGRALAVLGRLSLWQGDHAHVRQPMEQAVRLLRSPGDRASLSYALHGLAIAELLHGRFDEARSVMDESESLLDAGQASALAPWIEYWRGVLAERAGDAGGARQAYERALGAAQRIGHKTATGHALCATGRMLAAAGTIGDADRMLRAALAVFRDIEDRWGIEAALQGLARTAVGAGRPERAAALLGVADLIREELGIDQLPGAKAYQDATTAAALGRITEPAFWCAWKEGRHKPLSDLVTDEPPEPIAAGPAVRVDAAPQPVDLRIRTLGGFDVWARTRRVERSAWGSSRARELLAFLACHGEGSTKGQIGLALWPDASPAQLRNTFHVTMHRLRRALALPDAIEVDGERYRLNPALSRELDAENFEREVREALRELRRGADATATLAQAAARYRGDFLAGETVGEWADAHRDRLRELQAEALDALGRAHMERSRYLEAADAFRALLEVDPVNEDACRRQMTCLAQIGDRGAALRAYDALVRALRDELGVRPGRETSVLRDRLFSAT